MAQSAPGPHFTRDPPPPPALYEYTLLSSLPPFFDTLPLPCGFLILCARFSHLPPPACRRMCRYKESCTPQEPTELLHLPTLWRYPANMQPTAAAHAAHHPAQAAEPTTLSTERAVPLPQFLQQPDQAPRFLSTSNPLNLAVSRAQLLKLFSPVRVLATSN